VVKRSEHVHFLTDENAELNHFALSRVNFPAKLIVATFLACARTRAAQRFSARAEPLVTISRAGFRTEARPPVKAG
jgi:hypothetical protein